MKKGNLLGVCLEKLRDKLLKAAEGDELESGGGDEWGSPSAGTGSNSFWDSRGEEDDNIISSGK